MTFGRFRQYRLRSVLSVRSPPSEKTLCCHVAGMADHTKTLLDWEIKALTGLAPLFIVKRSYFFQTKIPMGILHANKAWSRWPSYHQFQPSHTEVMPVEKQCSHSHEVWFIDFDQALRSLYQKRTALARYSHANGTSPIPLLYKFSKHWHIILW